MKKIISLMLCVMLLSGCVAALAQAAQTAQVTAVMTGPNGAKLRSKPSAYGDNVLINLAPYVELEVISFDEEWYRVRFNDTRGYVHSGVVFISDYSDDPADYTGADVPESYLAEQQMWAAVTDLHGQTFLFDGNRNAAFSGRNVNLMDGEYWRYGGHAVEATGTVINKGANLRRNMDRDDTNGVLIYNMPRRTPLMVHCYFYDAGGSVWYYVTVGTYEGYVHSTNVELDIDIEFEEEEEDNSNLFF